MKKEMLRIVQPRKNIMTNLINDFFETEDCWIGKRGKRKRETLLVRAKI